MSFVKHAEEYLGEVSHGWKECVSGQDIRVVSFRDKPAESITTYLSLGMNKDVMPLSESKSVRQELVFSIYSVAISNLIVSFLMSLCEAILARGRAVFRGEVIPLSKELASRIGFDAVYCAIPVFFDDGFRTYTDSSPSTVVVWVIPIHKSEARYIEVNGWEAFEDLLEQSDPDLCSLSRQPVI
jgi:hypothetical protein